jgi:hypothetical protein
MTKGTRMLLVCALASALVAAGCGRKEETVSTETSATTETSSTMAADTAATMDTAATTATTATTTTDAQSTGVAECDSYLAALDKYMKCDKVPQAARDAQQQSAQMMRNSWATWANLPEASRKAAQDAAKTACTTALTTLKQAATASGCPVE